jgi:hypothetical protein
MMRPNSQEARVNAQTPRRPTDTFFDPFGILELLVDGVPPGFGHDRDFSPAKSKSAPEK